MHTENTKLRKKNHLFKSMLFLSVFVITSIIIIFFIVLEKFEDTADTIIERDNQDLFDSLVKRENVIDKAAVNMIVGLNSTYHVSTLKYTVFDETEINLSIRTLNLMLKYNIEALESCYVFNFTNDRIYLLGFRSGLFNEEDFFDRDILGFLETEMRNNTQRVTTTTRTFTDENGDVKNVYSYVIVDNCDKDGLPIDAIVLNISIDEAYEDLISQNTDLAIIDNSGNILKLSGSIPETEYVALYFQDQLPSRIKIAGEEYLVTSARLEQNDWLIISLTPTSMLTGPISLTKLILLIFLSVFILFVIFSSYLISSYLYSPIDKIMKKIPSSQGDEFKAIQNYILAKEEALDELNDKLAENQPFIKLRFLADLLKSPMDESVLRSEIKKLSFNIPLRSRIYAIRVMIDDRYAFTDTFSSYEQMDFRNSLLKQMVSALKDYRCEYHYTNDYTNFTIVASSPENVTDDEKSLTALLSAPRDSFWQSTGYSISILISKPVSSLNDLHIAYSALKAMEEDLFFAAPASILTQSEPRADRPLDLADLPIKEIGEAILGQRRDDFIAQTDKAFSSMANTDYYTATYLAQSIDHAIISAIRTYQDNSHNDLGLISSGQIVALQHLSFLSEIQQETTALGLKAIDMMIDIRGNVKDRLLGEIDTFIEEHYRDVNLSSTMIADQFHLTAPYINKLYRTATGDSLLNAINNFRLEKAAQLLKTTDLTVEEIASKVGWDNVKHFYSKFKNYYGITPKEYRNAEK